MLRIDIALEAGGECCFGARLLRFFGWLKVLMWAAESSGTERGYNFQHFTQALIVIMSLLIDHQIGTSGSCSQTMQPCDVMVA